MAFNLFPEINFRQVNLDWILSQIKNVQSYLAEIPNMISEAVSNINVQQAVDNKIDQLVESGALDDMALSAFNRPMLKDTIDSRIFGTWGYSNNRDGYMGQGFAVGRHNGSLTYFLCYKNNTDESQPGYIDLIDASSGTFIDSITVTEMVHGNCLNYFDGKLYLSTYNKLIIFNADTLAKVMEYTTPNYANMVDTDYIYVIHEGVIDRYTHEFQLVDTHPFTFPGSANVTSQGATCDDNYLYLAYNANPASITVNLIDVYDKNSFTKVKTCRYIERGELEDLSVFEGRYYASVYSRSKTVDGKFTQYSEFFPFTGFGFYEFNSLNYDVISAYVGPNEVYVDSNHRAFLTDGRTRATAFPSMRQAMEAAYRGDTSFVRFNVYGNFDEEIQLFGVGNQIVIKGYEGATIRSIVCQNITAYLYNLKITGVTNYTGTAGGCQIGAHSSIVYVNGCTFDGSGMNYIIHGEFGGCIIAKSCTFNSAAKRGNIACFYGTILRSVSLTVNNGKTNLLDPIDNGANAN